MSMESWSLLERTTDRVVVLRRINPGNRVTVWTLVPHGDTWRVVAIRFSRPNMGCNHKLERTKTYTANEDGAPCGDACWDHAKHLRGIRLSGNRIDRYLLDYCEGRRP